jgi:hypothetical protein
VTDDSQSGVRGYGPFPEGAEPTERMAAQAAAARPVAPDATVTPADPRIPAQRAGDSESTPPGVARTAATDDPESPASLPQDGSPEAPDVAQPTGDVSRPTHAAEQPTGVWQPADPQPQPPFGVVQPPPAAQQPPYASGQPSAAPPQPPYGSGQASAAPPLPPYASGQPSAASPQPPYASGQPSVAAPEPPYGFGQPPAAPHQPAYAEDQPTSGTPYGPTPTSPPYSGAPYPSADPYAFDQPIYTPTPSSGSPQHANEPAYGPFHGGAPASDPDSYGFSAPPGRRIEPSPPPDRGRLITGVVAGLVVGLLVFGTAGWFAGRATAPEAKPPAQPAAAPTSKLGVFEQNQVAINQPDFAGTGLVNIAQGWLPYLATCTRSGTQGGPALNDGEKFRVRCTLDGMSAIFVEYKSTGERDTGRDKILGRAAEDARSLAPGAAPASKRATPSGRTSGNYIEYAYRLTERGTTRTVSGIWWEDERTPVIAYLLAYWKDGVGESWEPMRDLWSRYA